MNKIEGGGLKVGQIKDFLNAGYAENPPNQLGKYQLDIEQVIIEIYSWLRKISLLTLKFH